MVRAPWPFVAMVSATGVAAIGLACSFFACRRDADTVVQSRFHVAAAAALVHAEVLLIVASMSAGCPGPATFAAFHLLFLVCLLGVAVMAGWLELAVLGSALAGAAASVWLGAHPEPEQWTGVLTLAAPLYLLFLAYPLVLGRRVGKAVSPHLAAVMASAWFFHVGRLALLSGGYESVIGALPVAQAALGGVLLAALLKLEPPSGRTLGRLALVAGAVLAFVTVAIPLQLHTHWITIGWALEGAALAWLFRRVPHRGLFWCALALLGLVFARLANPEVLLYQTRSDARIFNWYLYTYLTCSAAMLAAGALFSKTDDEISAPMRASEALPAVGTILLFLLLNIEIANFYATETSFVTFNLLADFAQNLTYTLGWATFAVALLTAGIALRSHAARIAAIVLLTVTVLKGFLWDVRSLGGLYRVMSFVGLAVCLALVAVAIQRFVLAPKAKEEQVRQGQ